MDKHSNLLAEDSLSLEALNSSVEIALGQWAVAKNAAEDWVYDNDGLLVEKENQVLCCVSLIGSNYVEFSGPKADRYGQKVFRIHHVEFWSRIKLISEEMALNIIARETKRHQDSASNLLSEIKKLTAALGLSKTKTLGNGQSSGNDSTGLVVINAQANVEQYGLSLQKAKEDLLPALYEDLKKTNVSLVKWLGAPSLSTLCQITDMQDHINTINDRLFSLTLYAGLCENLVKIRDGEPALITEKLHVMQRRCYMDEECLANYKAGGMSFNHIDQFDQWLCETENFERIFPYPRCVVAFRVRRNEAKRSWDGSLLQAHINMQLANSDKKTFLYFRNGEQLWWLETEIDFDAQLFPDSTVFDPSEPMMFKLFGSRVDRFMTRREYESLWEERERLLAANEEWEQENPYEEWAKNNHNASKSSYNFMKPSSVSIPYHLELRELNDWHELNSDSVYFDDAMSKLEDQFKRYNRIATVLQGVFDRSQALHPHAPAKLWTAEGFSQSIELVYDANMVIANGEKPDVESYIQRCNELIGLGSVVTGQTEYWLKSEAKKEMKRRQNDWRLSSTEKYRELERYQPCENPGPGDIETVQIFNAKSKTVTFKWTKEAKRYPYNPVECSLTVPYSELFNISAYTPGDFKLFFQDHRTRQEYLKWAPFLLAAEDWWAAQGKGKGAEEGET